MSIITKFEKNGNADKFLEDNKNFLVILYFAAEWSDECKTMNAVFNELEKDKKYLSVLKVLYIEAEDNEELSMKYGIDVVPTFIFIKNNHLIHQTSGANAVELTKKINDLVASVSQTTSNNDDKSLDLNSKLKKLINASTVMLFMKGTPQEPRCGFSRQTIELLNGKQVKFGSFDILTDNEVREGLKTFSNWPTYPQLYIKGELVGGLDILKELIASGEFDSMLPNKEASLEEKLKKLINQSKVMLFMKGSIKEPKCGFSRQIIELLNSTEVKYDTFDILSDEEVRQGLKEFSKWPTYPQVYVDGELIGGLDILKELKENGELVQALKGK